MVEPKTLMAAAADNSVEKTWTAEVRNTAAVSSLARIYQCRSASWPGIIGTHGRRGQAISICRMPGGGQALLTAGGNVF